MSELLLSPFKAVYDLNVYIKATKQSVGKTLLFLLYLFILTSLLMLAIIVIRTPSLTPALKDLTTKIAEYTPNIEAKNGILNANDGEYYEVTPEGFDQKIVFDTSRTEPVYPTQMQQDGIVVLVTSNAIYVNQENEMKVYNFKNDLNFSINKNLVLNNQDKIIHNIKLFLFWFVALAIPVVVFFMMMILMILAVIACAVSQLFVKAEVSFGEVCGICCYLIAPALLLILLVMLLPFPIPLVWLICFVMFMVYAQFILNNIKAQKNKVTRNNE